VRAVNDATDTEARTEMMYAAMLAGIAFNAAGCHLPHGLSYAVSGLTKDWHVDGYPTGKTLVPHGMAVVLNNPSVWRFTAPCCPERHLHGARCLGAKADGANAGDAGGVLAAPVVGAMRAARRARPRCEGRGSQCRRRWRSARGSRDRADARDCDAERPRRARLR